MPPKRRGGHNGTMSGGQDDQRSVVFRFFRNKAVLAAPDAPLVTGGLGGFALHFCLPPLALAPRSPLAVRNLGQRLDASRRGLSQLDRSQLDLPRLFSCTSNSTVQAGDWSLGGKQWQ
ncbi:hypothetical protein ACLKA6_020037 [Drosophila palustris]